MFDIEEELKKLPDKPGVYLMKDERGQIIYVGKAISLKKRVRQYFQSSRNNTPKVNAMVKKINEFEYIITDNEVEALILESNLIKKHKPKYNILLRDDKQYPYIKVTTNEKYPRVIKVRNVVKDGAKYFGPYTSAGAVNDTLEIIKSLYPIRSCRKNFDKGTSRDRPCLNYFIGKCLAPCQGNVDEDEYNDMIDEIIIFLNGKEHKLIEIMEEKMKKASKELDFESAARYRDQINSLKLILEKQKIVSTNIIDQDIIGIARGTEEACVQIFYVRMGKIMGRDHFILEDNLELDRKEVLSSFIKQFYLGSAYIPKEILVESDFEDIESISEWLTEKRGSKVYIKIPKRGDKSDLMNMVRENAVNMLKQYNSRIKRKSDEGVEYLKELAEYIGLDKVPRRIEAFDISNIQGMESVGSMVVFENGLPKKSDYRRFKIKTIIGADDYGSMQEMLVRRFERGLKEKDMVVDNKVCLESFSVFPDLIMMDGGKGQVNVAKRVLEAFNIQIPVCGIVKDDYHRTRAIIFNGKEIKIPENSQSFKLITRIQDEAHRFAITYHRSLRDKKVFKSVLDDIIGIGDKRKKSLLREFGSIEKISEASIDELIKAEGMNKKAAEAVFDFFRRK